MPLGLILLQSYSSRSAHSQYNSSIVWDLEQFGKIIPKSSDRNTWPITELVARNVVFFKFWITVPSQPN
ncbi:MAG: hypothetical protein ACNS60_01675 [Candidatus Cyclobacteriaceae bacterium M2_1C_046]